MTSGVRVIDLPVTSPAWDSALPVLVQLRPALDREHLQALLLDASGQGPRFIGAVGTGGADGAESVLGVAGYRVIANTSNGRKLYVDDLVTAAGHR